MTFKIYDYICNVFKFNCLMKKFVNQRLSEDKMRVVLGGENVSESSPCSCTCPGEDSTQTTGLHSIATFNAAPFIPGKGNDRL